MAIANSYSPTQVSGDGVLTNFSFDFRIYESDDIIVKNILKVSPFTEILQVNGVDYSVNINLVSEGGSIDYLLTPPPATHNVFIESALEDTQPTSFPLDAKLREESVETMGDRVTRLVQQNTEKLGRALLFLPSTDLTGITITVPPPLADALIGWDTAGTALENKPGFAATVATVTALAAAAAASAAAASASEAAASASETAAGISAASAAADAVSTAADAVSTAADVTASAISAAAALASELAAAASAAAAALSASNLEDTSITSFTPSLGSKIFTTIGSGKSFDPGRFLTITSDAGPTADVMEGEVTAYAGSTLTVNILKFEASGGAKADWTIRIAGSPGIDGASGTDFLGLSDTPGSFVGETLRTVRVNAGETALEFFTAAAGIAVDDENNVLAVQTFT